MSDDNVDQGHATPSWTFDQEVTRVFDNMLERSIPQYDVMRSTVLDLADDFAPNGGIVLDLGAARGGATAELIERRGAQLRYHMVEPSKPMYEAIVERFKSPWIAKQIVSVTQGDLRKVADWPRVAPSVVMSILTIQFIPIEYRQMIFRKIYKTLEPGGALILVEKVLGNTHEIDEVMTQEYLNMKHKNGYSQEEIQRKKLSLEGVLVPVTSGMNEEFIRQAGFRQVDCFWRWMNFAGWLAIKED